MLEVRGLKVHYPLARTHPFAERNVVRAVDGVSFSVSKGSCFGLVGESGSGKSTVALACMRLVQATAGEILLSGENVSALEGEALRRMRPRFQIVFQDPYSSLNPRQRAGAIVREPMDLMEIGTQKERAETVAELFFKVGLRPEQQALFPHQFSGGQRQRIAIARALATRPDLLILDEPVSALDVAIQAQILNLLKKLQAELDLTYLFISHDLGVVQHMCDRVGVMYLGRIVEEANRRQLFRYSRHPYTRALLEAVPSLERRRPQQPLLKNDPPNPINPPTGCPFHPRCSKTETDCRHDVPILRTTEGNSLVACHFPEPVIGNYKG